jgi:hypothetical protein
MKENNLMNRINEEQDNFEFRVEDLDMDNSQTLFLLSEGNPGTHKVLIALSNQFDATIIRPFYNNIWQRKLLGFRLWYLYKNVCCQNLTELLSLDLTPFTDEFFSNIELTM